jgi:peptidoglycan/LPS O-acetylase OafA/YrhL
MRITPFNNGMSVLRGIAVILVVLFHAGATGFNGGYVGVDIFFLLSGFLIAASLTNSFTDYEFDWGKFYGKRVRKIIPPLILTVVLVLATFYYMWGLCEDFIIFTWHGFLSLSGVSNFDYMVNANTGMFNYSPFLHLWSLSLEMQFYLIAPIIYVFLYYRKANMVKILTTVTVVSFLLNIIINFFNPMFAYYFSLTRIWEFTLGALIYTIIQSKPTLHTLNLTLKQFKILAWISAAVLIFFVAGFNTVLPASPTLNVFPIVAAAYLIYYFNINDLSSKTIYKPLHFLSKISYPLYLTHYPVMFFMNIYYPDLMWFSIPFSIMLSYVIYYLVERRFVKNDNASLEN